MTNLPPLEEIADEMLAILSDRQPHYAEKGDGEYQCGVEPDAGAGIW